MASRGFDVSGAFAMLLDIIVLRKATQLPSNTFCL
jgi:hypothetical protein